MGLLVDGVWQEERHEVRTQGGRFMRATTRYRNWVTEDGSPGPSGEAGLRRRDRAITSMFRCRARGHTGR